MNLEAIPNKPKQVEIDPKELLPKAQEMIEDSEKIDTYIDMKIAQLDPVTKELISKEVGQNGKTIKDGLRERVKAALPTHLDSVAKYGGTNEKFELAVNKLIEKAIGGYKM